MLSSEIVLIVDDSVIMRGVIKKSLQMIGYSKDNLFEAKDGDEALVKLESIQPNLLISDLNMPKMSGLEMVTNLRKNRKLDDVSILIVSTEGSEFKQKQLLLLPKVNFLRKPFNPETLSNAIKKLKESADGI